MGESAVDTGGPAWEFWRLLMGGMELRYCRTGEAGCFFEKNVPALQVAIYYQTTTVTESPMCNYVQAYS